MPLFTNKAKLAIAPSVWLMEDSYDYNDDPFTISATTLLQPIKPIIFAAQAQGDSTHTIDLVEMIAARMGIALHDSLEDCWKDLKQVRKSMKQIGIPDSVIKRIRINPNDLDVKTNEDIIPIYIENRSVRKIGKWTITGKYDLIIEGEVQDYKSTSVWGYIFDSNSEDYSLQGSIYRWLNPDKITQDTIAIHYIFTDWSKIRATQDKKSYPQTRILTKQIRLKSPEWIENFMRVKLDKLEKLLSADQGQMPFCTPDELWQKEAKWKYYKDPLKLQRSTKNFDNEQAAQTHWANEGTVGKVVEFPGEVVRCKYCSAIEICDQAQGYIKSGLIKFD